MKNKIINQIRQGDILLNKLKKLPQNIKETNKVLAYGEVTGHKHQFIDKNAIVFIDNDGRQYVQIVAPSVLQHEEHENHVVPVGVYEVVHQRENDLVQGIQQVRD